MRPQTYKYVCRNVVIDFGADPRTPEWHAWALSPITVPVLTGGPTWWAKQVVLCFP